MRSGRVERRHPRAVLNSRHPPAEIHGNPKRKRKRQQSCISNEVLFYFTNVGETPSSLSLTRLVFFQLSGRTIPIPPPPLFFYILYNIYLMTITCWNKNFFFFLFFSTTSLPNSFRVMCAQREERKEYNNFDCQR